MATAMGIDEAYQQGFTARCNGQYGEARLYMQRVLQLEPSHVGAQHQLGLIQGFEGDFDGSLDTLRALSLRIPGNLEVMYDLAMTEMMLGMYEEACGNLKRILSAVPANDADEKVQGNARRQSAYC